MKLIRLLIVLAIAGFAYQSWTRHHAGGDSAGGGQSSASARGFVALPPITGASPAAVAIVAAENCPEEAAQRADRLADGLARQGVPVARLHNVSFEIPDSDPAIANRVMAVMNSELPIVFVRGRAKSNPSLEEVAAEYRAAAL